MKTGLRLFCSLSKSFCSLPNKGMQKFYSSLANDPKICVVGSGPAGFGISQYLLKNHDTLKVDMVERYPIPYGLIRYGVSPDHQDVKNCIHGYEKVAENPRFSFYGNITVGKCVMVDELIRRYNAVVLCTGAQELHKLDIPGEDLSNVYSSKEFVGWYNGVPEYRHLDPDLSVGTVVIIGVGNVALDCARMLLKPHTMLEDTDVTSVAYQCLAKSNIKKVVLVGRRGPLQMACTRKELAEITELDNVITTIDRSCFNDQVKEALKVKNLKLRKTQRLVKYLMETSKSSENMPPGSTLNELNLKLLRSPLEITGNEQVEGVLLRKNIMSGEDAFNPTISSTDETEKLQCGIVISCIGYRNEPLDGTIPFEKGRIKATKGKVDTALPLYACGWCKNGPKGVLADTLNDCLVTGGKMLEDMASLTTVKLQDDKVLPCRPQTSCNAKADD